ncbi:hypothetical protein RAS1_25630 [Phycisphaerae bacterium RAS1]|nr:hypothetical protein RAS1_25630 [Phycisphaerae bacterium RAS1]
MPLIALDIAPSVIQNIQAPPGWIVLDPRDPGRTNINHPFYQNDMEDGHPFPAPFNPSVTPPVLVRALNGAAALLQTNPAMTIVVFSTPTAQVGPIECWSGGPNPQMLLGPIPPGGGGVPAVTDAGAAVLACVIVLAAVVILWKRGGQGA